MAASPAAPRPPGTCPRRSVRGPARYLSRAATVPSDALCWAHCPVWCPDPVSGCLGAAWRCRSRLHGGGVGPPDRFLPFPGRSAVQVPAATVPAFDQAFEYEAVSMADVLGGV